MLSEYIPFVKWQANFNRKNYNRTTDPRKKEILSGIIQQFESLLLAMQQAQEKLANIQGSASPISSLEEIDSRVALRPKDIADLPPEILEQLSIKSNGDDVEIAIQEIISAAGGAMSLDQIIIGYYRKTGETIKRNVLNAKLYRMAKKDLVHSIPGKKGVYCTFDPSNLINKEEDVSDK